MYSLSSPSTYSAYTTGAYDNGNGFGFGLGHGNIYGSGYAPAYNGPDHAGYGDGVMGPIYSYGNGAGDGQTDRDSIDMTDLAAALINVKAKPCSC